MNILQSRHCIDRYFQSVICVLMVLSSCSSSFADEPADKTKTSSPGVSVQEIAPSPVLSLGAGQQASTSMVEDSLSGFPLPPATYTPAAVVRQPRLLTAGQRVAEIVIQFPGKSRYAVTVNGTEHRVSGSELHLRTSISQRTGAEVRISVRHLGLAPEVQLGANALKFSETVRARESSEDNKSIMRLQADDGSNIESQADRNNERQSELCILLHAGDRVRISATTP